MNLSLILAISILSICSDLAFGIVPMPVKFVDNKFYQLLDNPQVTYDINSSACFSVQEAVKRVMLRMERSIPRVKLEYPVIYDEKSMITSINIRIKTLCSEIDLEEYPNENMDEAYTILVESKNVTILANEKWGIIRGLQTFYQLVRRLDAGALAILNSRIIDMPRFKHRGYLIDTSRHYLKLKRIMKFIDLMEMNKMNVLHWHMIDDQSFPYQSYTFQNLWKMGSYDELKAIYSQDEIKLIINYAGIRGIRVMIEIDTPGHTGSWIGLREMQTACYHGSVPSGTYGPLDPSLNITYDNLRLFFNEISTVFPERYIHLGGDEVDTSCWNSNPHIQAFMKEMKFKSMNQLEAYYINNIYSIVNDVDNATVKIFWEEVYFNDAIPLNNDSIVHLWKSSYKSKIDQVTSQGKRVILSSPWYLNYISFGNDMSKYYDVNPTDGLKTDEQKKLVIGGEACMWGEYVNDGNFISRSWPRGSSVAERLWSSEDVNDFSDFVKRLSIFSCYMLKAEHKIGEIIGPSYCD